ncbi:MAG: shikimate kinase [Dehalococcoidales bacterium]|nr:shikimate kinase [Dehalococcoidales bacterium]
MKNNIVLVGFMGTGKTAVGRVLAAKLGKEFIELDALIEKRAGEPIPEIFARHGEIRFRELEIAAVKSIARRKNAVIACGGGAVLNKINIDRLSERGKIVYLGAAPEVILRRITEDKTERPLLKAEDRLRQIRELLNYRKPYYERAADIKIDTSLLGTEEVVGKIIKRLKR